MEDKVFIKNLVLPCNIGVTDEERRKKQNVIFGIEIFYDLKSAGITDDLSKTIDYAEIQEKLANAVSSGEFKLLETVAQTVASLILKDAAVSCVKVAVMKEKYSEKPIMGIEITRDQNG